MTFKSKDGVYILAHASADFGYDEVSFSTHELTQTNEGDLTQKVSLSFYDYSPDSGKLKTVHLTFDYDKRENEYFLTDKSDE